MKKKDIQLLLSGCSKRDARYVIAHAKWQRSRGRKPSEYYKGEGNPAVALTLAIRDFRQSFEIPCPHDSGQVMNSNEEAPDHHSLIIEEIAELLELAKQSSSDCKMIAKVQVRLSQGIVGLVCPRSIEGRTANQRNKLDELFVREYKKGSDPRLVNRLHQIMNG